MRGRSSRDGVRFEGKVWSRICGDWRPIFGGMGTEGFSIEWHDFSCESDIEWGRSFHRRSLEICLNFSGDGMVQGTSLRHGSAAVYTIGDAPIVARRLVGARHRFLTFEFAHRYVSGQLGDFQSALLPGLAEFLRNPGSGPGLLWHGELPPHLLLLRSHLQNPPVANMARTLWIRAKLEELLASLLFIPAEPPAPSARQDIAEKVLYFLRRDMANPPSLEMLATEIGKTPFQLSRIFTAQCGCSIPAALRALRLEEAASQLRSSLLSVTEIAFSIGYSSLGAFNKGFLERFGITPTEYRKRFYRG